MHSRKHQISNPVDDSATAASATRPDPEVVPAAKRRTFSPPGGQMGRIDAFSTEQAPMSPGALQASAAARICSFSATFERMERMKREDAVKINEHIETMISIANDVLYIGNNSDDDGNREIIRDVLANVVTALDFDILEPIYKQYPDLRPPNLEELK